MRVDDALELIGGYGRYQLCVFVLIGLNFMYTPMHIFSDVFTAFEPDHWCRVELPPGDNVTLEDLLPYEKDHDGKMTISHCSMYEFDDEDGNKTVPCKNGFEYDMNGGPTVVTEWQLSCNESRSVMTTTVHGASAVLGAVLFSPFADTYGRKALFLLCWWQTALLSLGMMFVNDISSFWVLRFLSRLYTEGSELAMFLLACEFFPVKQRPFAAFAIYMFYAMGQMMLAMQAYFIRNWRYLQLAISAGIFVLLPFSMFLPESPHWLASWGRTREAERIFRRAAKFNGVVLPHDFRIDSSSNGHSDGHSDSPTKLEPVSIATIRKRSATGDTRLHELHPHLSHFSKLAEYLRNSTLRRDFLIASFLWAVSAYIYYGLTVVPISIPLQDGLYLNYFLGGAIMIPAFTSIFLLKKFGRKIPLLVFFLLTGVFVIGYSLVPKSIYKGRSLGLLTLTLKLVAKCATTAALVSTRLLVAEIFPTTVRSTFVGLSAFIGFLGGSAGLYFPLMKKLSKWYGVAMGGMAIVAAMLCIPLPETSNRPLPENIKDLLMQYRHVMQNMLLSQLNGLAGGAGQSSEDTNTHPASKNNLLRSERRSSRSQPYITSVSGRSRSSPYGFYPTIDIATQHREKRRSLQPQYHHSYNTLGPGITLHPSNFPSHYGDTWSPGRHSVSGRHSPRHDFHPTFDNPNFVPEQDGVTKL